jgi:hypothetical protein
VIHKIFAALRCDCSIISSFSCRNDQLCHNSLKQPKGNPNLPETPVQRSGTADCLSVRQSALVLAKRASRTQTERCTSLWNESKSLGSLGVQNRCLNYSGVAQGFWFPSAFRADCRLFETGNPPVVGETSPFHSSARNRDLSPKQPGKFSAAVLTRLAAKPRQSRQRPAQ